MKTRQLSASVRQFDRRVREQVQDSLPANTAKAMAPLFPLGLPIGYLGIGYGTAHWMHNRGRRGGPAIVTAAWLGWVVQRAAKLIYHRERPRRPGIRRRTDSWPSGHTTGTTALAVSAALVLRREKVVSAPAAVAIGVGAPLLMGAYRVIDDEHWATDVFAGWALGAVIGIACTAALGNRRGIVTSEIRARASSRPAFRRRGHQE